MHLAHNLFLGNIQAIPAVCGRRFSHICAVSYADAFGCAITYALVLPDRMGNPCRLALADIHAAAKTFTVAFSDVHRILRGLAFANGDPLSIGKAGVGAQALACAYTFACSKRRTERLPHAIAD